MDTLSQRLKMIRGNMNQTEFGVAFGISQRSVSRYETGGGSPDIDTINAICAKYGVNPQWLAFGIGPMRQGEADSQEEGTVASPPTTEVAWGAPSCKRCDELLSRLLAEHDRFSVAQDRLNQAQEEAKALLKENGDLKAEIGELREQLAVSKKILEESGLAEDLQRSA